MKRRITGRAVIVSAVLAVGVAGGGVAAAQQVRANIWAQQDCRTLEARLDASGELAQGPKGETSAIILGDSYTAGDVLDNRTDGWAYKLGAAEGWDTRVAGIGGSGFVNEGPCQRHAYPNRMGKVATANPQKLIIQGGLNDWEATPQDVETAARTVLDKVKAVQSVVMVGPTNAPSRSEKMPEIDAALARAAESRGVRYVSALDWDLEYAPDRLHLTPAGHTRFATLVAEAID